MQNRIMTRPRGLSLVVALAIIVSAFAAEPVQAADEPTITFAGGGWGHSVGMSQYGAYGQALEGRSWQQILSQYFTGVGFSPLGQNGQPALEPIWVGLEQNMTVASFTPISISGAGAPAVVTRGGEVLSVAPQQVVTVTSGEAGCSVSSPAGNLPFGSCTIDIKWDGWVDEPTTRIVFGTRSYSRGTIHIRPAGIGFHVSVEADLEKYLYGIAEVPSSWPMEALRAQAVAARSYAANRMVTRGDPSAPDRQDACWCHVYDTVVDQNYVGWGFGGSTWTAAVNDTANVVVTHPSVAGPVATFYSSSTFGRTEDSGIGFGSGNTLPYLVGVDDHWSAHSRNPYATWVRELPASSVAGQLGMDEVSAVAISKWSTSGAATEITFTGLVNGGAGSKTFTTSRLRTLLSLRSMQVTAAYMPPPKPVQPTIPAGPGRVALQDPTSGLWHIRNADGSVTSFYYGNPRDIPFTGDWNCDGITTLGLYRTSAGYLFLRNSNTQGIADIEIYYGIPGDKPIAGDWNGDGCETVGIFRPGEARFYLRNTNTQGVADLPPLSFGQPGDIPLAGDWNGDGIDTIGVYRPGNKTLYLSNSLTSAVADFAWVYTGAAAGDRPIVGDWNDDGIDTMGIFRPSTGTFYLRDTYTQASANVVIPMGDSYMNPVAGFWGP